MTPYNLAAAVNRAHDADAMTLLDPGSGGTVTVHNKGLAILKLTSTGARTLASAASSDVGDEVLVVSSASSASVNSVDVADGGYILFRVTLDASAVNQWTVVSSSQLQSLALGSKTLDIAIDNEWRVWDALITNLAGADGTDDLGLVTGTYLTSDPTFNVTVATPTTAPFYARRSIQVPWNYDAGSNLTLKITVTETVAATTATVDANAVRQGAPSVDIVATAAQSIIGAAATVYSFTLTGTNVVPGEVLDVRIAITLNDASATPNYSINKVELDYTAA
jgi:hypothetical protein